MRDDRIDIIEGDCLAAMRGLPDGHARCCVTSPPYYGLRDYGHEGQIGLEPTPGEYVGRLVEVFREVRRILAVDGTLWLNLGDSYNADGRKGRAHMGEGKNAGYSAWVNKTGFGTKPKDRLGIPHRVVFALQEDGWYWRDEIVWHKPNPMPESVRDRTTKAHEMVFLLSKRERYFYGQDAIKEESTTPPGGACFGKVAREGEAVAAGQAARRYERPDYRETGRNARSVWTINPQPFADAHFATMPLELAERCIKAGSEEGDNVFDPFGGAGTTALASYRLRRSATLAEINPAFAAMARRRVDAERHKLALLDSRGPADAQPPLPFATA